MSLPTFRPKLETKPSGNPGVYWLCSVCLTFDVVDDTYILCRECWRIIVLAPAALKASP